MICVSLANIGFDECVRALNMAEFVEIRIDQLNFSDDQFRTLFSLKRNTVATCRPEKGSQQRRMQLLKLAIESGAGYVDIEFEAEEAYRNELIAFAKIHNTLSIISYHNYQETPAEKDLDDIIGLSFAMGCDRVKLAVMANSKCDCSRIMGLYDRHNDIIAFCMGEIGAISRVAATILGADFTFAAYSKELATAPGQLTIGEMLDVYDIIKN